MVRTVSATEARVHFGELMDEVEAKGRRIIIAKSGQPKVAMISISDYERLPPRDDVPEEWETRLDRLHRTVRRERSGKPLSPPPEEMIRQIREES